MPSIDSSILLHALKIPAFPNQGKKMLLIPCHCMSVIYLEGAFLLDIKNLSAAQRLIATVQYSTEHSALSFFNWFCTTQIKTAFMMCDVWAWYRITQVSSEQKDRRCRESLVCVYICVIERGGREDLRRFTVRSSAISSSLCRRWQCWNAVMTPARNSCLLAREELWTASWSSRMHNLKAFNFFRFFKLAAKHTDSCKASIVTKEAKRLLQHIWTTYWHDWTSKDKQRLVEDCRCRP